MPNTYKQQYFQNDYHNSLKSSAESREYMLTYFWGMGTYFYWGDGSIYLFGGMQMVRNLWGDEYPHPPLYLHPWGGGGVVEDRRLLTGGGGFKKDQKLADVICNHSRCVFWYIMNMWITFKMFNINYNVGISIS